MKCKGNLFIGFIKVGKKHLFIYDEIGKINEMTPLCVLDFYVYEKCQRAGYGKIIYSEMIEREKIEPRKLGYDRPSIKFMNFLRKYYKLADYVPQNNNYVVFKDYFRDNKKKEELNKYQISNYDNRKLNNINSFSNNSNRSLNSLRKLGGIIEANCICSVSVNKVLGSFL